MGNNANNVSLLDLPALANLVSVTPVSTLATGELVFQAGERCNSLPVVVHGSARVYASGNAGRQVTLYRLKPGDICPISLSTLLQDSIYPATATAENTLEVRYLDGADFHATVRRTPEVFGVFLDTFAACLYDSVCTARQLMFDPLDVRLAHLLDEQFAESPDQAINLTHEDIANELGTTRVVASRMLKKLEHANCIRLCRRKIALQDAEALKKLTRGDLSGSNPA